ncbi:MAG TPA: hypothetical protein VGS13_03340, partial [Stellaceae bacterium]|nr:hypothetical protein [Stellaceae bacterium]
ELGSAASVGTLSGLGTKYLGFSNITVDPGAGWVLSGDNTLAGGVTLTDLGTLTNTGSLSGAGTLIVDPATLLNSGSIGLGVTLAGGGTLNNQTGGAITAAGIAVSATGGGATIVNSGTITGTGGTAVQFGAGDDTLIVKPGAVFAGAVSGGGGTNTIIQGASGTLKVTGFSGFETIRLANGGADSLTLTGSNFTGVGGHVITVFDGNSGNSVTASALPSADVIVVHAGIGADKLRGGAGSDTFYAGGKTTMTGGAGANHFTFAHIGTNVVTDFGASAKNELVLRKSGFNLGADESLATGTPKHLATSVFVANSTGTFTTTAQRFAYNKTTGRLSYSAHGSGSAATTVVTLTGHPSLSAGATGDLFFTS